MLISRNDQGGFTLVETLIALAIVAILLFLAAPTFTAWIQNTRIRTTGDSILTGLQLARAEAVRRNIPMRFQLTDTADNTCALSTTGTNWVISLTDPTGICATAPSDTGVIYQVRSAAEASGNTTVAAGQAVYIYNGLGRLTAAPVGVIDIQNPTNGACATASGPTRCLRIVVSLSGLARMCDPARTSTDPQSC